MFEIKNRYYCFKYDINFIDILDPFIELSKDILTINIKEAELVDVVDFSIINEEFQNKFDKYLKDNIKEIKPNDSLVEKQEEIQNSKTEEYERLIFESKDVFEQYLTQKVFGASNLKSLINTGILFLLRIDKKIVSYDDQSINSLNKLLSEFGVINYFQTLLKGDLLKSATTNFNKFDKIQFYQTNDKLSTEKLNIVYCPIIEYNFIDTTKIQLDYCEKDDVWINVTQIKKKFNIDIQLSDIKLVKLNDSSHIIGLKVGDYFLSFDFDMKSIISIDKIVEFYWLLIYRDVYRQQPEKLRSLLPSLVQEFNKAVRKESFINLLSQLKKNLYLEDQVIAPEFEVFFDSVLSLNSLKHIENYEFYVPDSDGSGKPILGIYKEDKKPKETYYNLIHWVTNKDDRNYNHFHEETPQSKQKKILKALKPEISFYFRSNFFEDYVSSILDELKLKYTSNYNLILKDESACEIDFLIYNNSTIYFIEAKTKLSSFYIDNYEKKCNKILNNLNGIEDKVKFLLVSAFSDRNCEQYKYYIEKSDKPELNVNRPGLATKTYYFDIPIQSHAGHEITCISEPVYDKLKTIISNICLH